MSEYRSDHYHANTKKYPLGTCKWCNEPFKRTANHQKFCNRKHYDQWKYVQPARQEYMKKYREENKEYFAQKRVEFAKRNPGYYTQKGKEWAERNPEYFKLRYLKQKYERP